MAGLRAFLAVASLSLLAVASPGKAQTPATENIQIGLSTDHVSI
ncbi:MAG: TIGR02186 family protein, partial [Mesorhizobium sp.]